MRVGSVCNRGSSTRIGVDTVRVAGPCAANADPYRTVVPPSDPKRLFASGRSNTVAVTFLVRRPTPTVAATL
jgi:hypothetical protein